MNSMRSPDSGAAVPPMASSSAPMTRCKSFNAAVPASGFHFCGITAGISSRLRGASRVSRPEKSGAALSRSVRKPGSLKHCCTVLMMEVWSNGVKPSGLAIRPFAMRGLTTTQGTRTPKRLNKKPS